MLSSRCRLLRGSPRNLSIVWCSTLIAHEWWLYRIPHKFPSPRKDSLGKNIKVQTHKTCIYSVKEYTWRILFLVAPHSVYLFLKGIALVRKTHPRDYTRRSYTPYRNTGPVNHHPRDYKRSINIPKRNSPGERTHPVTTHGVYIFRIGIYPANPRNHTRRISTT